MAAGPLSTNPPRTQRSTLLRLEGRDALPVLHRISTNALEDLAPGQCRATLFCDFRGRLLHRAIAALTRDGAVWLVRDDAPAASLAAFVDRNVFREDLRIEDRSGLLAVQVVLGEAASGCGTFSEVDGVPQELMVRAGYALALGPPAAEAPDPDAWALRRIEAGLPAHGHEIVEEFTPYEVNLADEVHLDKGCFTGQEALLRLLTYGGVRRFLSHVAGRGQPPEPPADVTRGGARLGRLTSAVGVPGEERWIGLAVLRREAAEPGGEPVRAGESVIDEIHPLAAARPLGRL